MKRSIGWLGLLAMLSIHSAQAANREIKASFAPDSAQPNKNIFINKTPVSGYCVMNPVECAKNNMFSIRLPIRFETSREMRPGDVAALKAPANWRRISVMNNDTRETETVEVRIMGVGSQYSLSDSAANLVGVTDILEGHQKLWTRSSWVYAPEPCIYSGVGFYSARTYDFFWQTPVEAPCVKVAAFAIPQMAFTHLDFAYELRTPDPLGMSSGVYTGSQTYSIGPGGDFDFGPLMRPDDGNLTLDFVLDVQHTLKVDIPPGGEKIQLVPAGGWQSWLQAGRRPVRLFRDQTFNISASSRFKVFLDCRFDTIFVGCVVRAPDGSHIIGVDVSISLPNGLTNLAGQPVRRQRLGLQDDAQHFQPGFYVDRAPGTLHFEIVQADVARMLRSGATKYSGIVTVIWDSEV